MYGYWSRKFKTWKIEWSSRMTLVYHRCKYVRAVHDRCFVREDVGFQYGTVRCLLLVIRSTSGADMNESNQSYERDYNVYLFHSATSGTRFQDPSSGVLAVYCYTQSYARPVTLIYPPFYRFLLCKGNLGRSVSHKTNLNSGTDTS
jgi:hypothetical protein